MEIGDSTEEHTGVSGDGNGRVDAFSVRNSRIVIPDLECGAGHTWSYEGHVNRPIPKFCPTHTDNKNQLVYKQMECLYDGHIFHTWTHKKSKPRRYCPRHKQFRKLICAAGHEWVWQNPDPTRSGNVPKWCPEHLEKGRQETRIKNKGKYKRFKIDWELQPNGTLLGVPREQRQETQRQLFETLFIVPPSVAYPAGTPQSRLLEGIQLKCVDYECKHGNLPNDVGIDCNCWDNGWITWAGGRKKDGT